MVAKLAKIQNQNVADLSARTRCFRRVDRSRNASSASSGAWTGGPSIRNLNIRSAIKRENPKKQSVSAC